MVLVPLPLAFVPPVTFKSPFAVRFAPEPMVNVPLLDVTSPVTLPDPFQLPPVTPSVPPMLPVLPKLITPLPVNVALPFTVPAPDKLPAVPTPTVLPDASEPSTCNVPPVTVVPPV